MRGAKRLFVIRQKILSMTTIAPDARIADTKTYPRRAAVVSWIFFDWAAQPYFTLITTFVFAPYFVTHVAPNPASGQAMWGFATAAAGLVIALLSPVLGAIADASGRRKRSEEHTSELQSLAYLVCRLLLEKKKRASTAGVPA